MELPKTTSEVDDDLFVKFVVMMTAFYHLENSQINYKTEGMSEDDVRRFGWQPFPVRKYLDVLFAGYNKLERRQTKRFLDIGCGIGTKVMLASVLFDADGFDISEEYIELAKKLGCHQVFVDDCLTFDRYGEYDFLYFFLPFDELGLQEELERKIHHEMKPGALVAPVAYSQEANARKPVLDWGNLPFMEQVAENLYVKAPECEGCTRLS